MLCLQKSGRELRRQGRQRGGDRLRQRQRPRSGRRMWPKSRRKQVPRSPVAKREVRTTTLIRKRSRSLPVVRRRNGKPKAATTRTTSSVQGARMLDHRRRAREHQVELLLSRTVAVVALPTPSWVDLESSSLTWSLDRQVRQPCQSTALRLCCVVHPSARHNWSRLQW